MWKYGHYAVYLTARILNSCTVTLSLYTPFFNQLTGMYKSNGAEKVIIIYIADML